MSKASPKKRPTTSGSPLKSPGKTLRLGDDQQIQEENHQLQLVIGDRDVEIERLKISITALNQIKDKLQDISHVANEHKETFGVSEVKRGELHTTIITQSQKTTSDAHQHDLKHEQNHRDISHLNAQNQQLKVQMAENENDHYSKVEQLNQEHYQEIQAKIQYEKSTEDEASRKHSTMEQSHLNQVDSMQRSNAVEKKTTDDIHQAELKKLNKEKVVRASEVVQQVRKLQSDHQDEVKKMQWEKRMTEERTENEASGVQHRHEKQTKDTLERHESLTQANQERHENEMHGAQERHESVTQANQERHENEMHGAQERHDSLTQGNQERHENEMNGAQNRHENAIRRMQAEYKDAEEKANSKLSRKEDYHADEMRKIRQEIKVSDDEHSLLIDNMRREFDETIKNMNNDFNRQFRQQDDKHTVDIQERIRKWNSLDTTKTIEIKNIMEEHSRILSELRFKMEEMRSSYEIKIDEMTVTIERKVQIILLRDSTILSLEQVLEVKKDVDAQHTEACGREHTGQKARENLQQELEQGTDYILQLEEKVYKANKTSLALLQQLKEAEVEIETLKQYIIDLKQRIAVYIPVRDDQIDKKLAEFINNYPERSKLKIMFMRETEGVYQFGTKRVAVKVEKDNIKIRVGGGYLSLDEFLDQYTPAELEKLERKDPLKRFSEKIAVQKTIVNAGVRENSPVRSPGRASPKRKLAV